MNIRYLIYTLIFSIGIAGILSFGLTLPVQAQSPTPMPTPDIVATLESQQSQITDLERDFENAQLDMRREIISWLAGVAILGAIVGGIAGAIGVREYLKKRFEEHIANAIYAVDPSNITIHIPDQNFAAEERHLRKVGFHRIAYYPYPRLSNNVLKGCLIYPAKDDNELEPLLEYIKENAPDPEYCAVLAYRGRYADAKIDEFIKLVRFSTPNMLTSLPSHIYGVVRGLKS